LGMPEKPKGAKSREAGLWVIGSGKAIVGSDCADCKQLPIGFASGDRSYLFFRLLEASQG
jgi:hypothetical protein